MPRKRAATKYFSVTQFGTRAQIRIRGELHRKHFPHHTDPLIIRQWLLKTELKFRGPRAVRTGKFCDDAQVYLEAVKAMPSFQLRKLHIMEWVEVFGARQRSDITADEIRAQLHHWRTATREITYTRVPTDRQRKIRRIVLSASAVNQRRTALQHMWTVLDGKAAQNPVKDTEKFREPDPRSRPIRITAVRKLLQLMGDTKSRARAMVLAFTGIPHKQIKTIKPEHVDYTAKHVLVAGRRKGAGTEARVVPLTPDGIKAFKAMRRTDAWGPFSNSSLRRALQTACAAAKLPPMTPYDLRHFFGSEVYRTSGDIRATQVLMGHSKPELTHRYTLAAVDPRVRAALDKFGQ